MSEDCPSCEGLGRQVFHGHFESVVGDCNFCKGSGDEADYTKWFTDRKVKATKERQVTG